MPKICYVPKRFKDATLSIISRAEMIFDDYSNQGYSLTVRQVYYQFVAQDYFPDSWIDDKYNRKHGLQDGTKNTLKNYKRLASIICDARMAGMLDWGVLEDRGRVRHSNPHWRNISGVLRTCVDIFQYDMWEHQPYRVEVWVEKEALIGVLERPCEALDVPYFATKGYNSKSAMWRSCQRLQGYADEDGQIPVIIHLTDHDPSGLNMTEDLENQFEDFRTDIEVHRIALTMAQIKEFDPPPNPAKSTDPRAKKYKPIYGDLSWELDALQPSYIEDLITKTVLEYRDESAYKDAVKRTEKARNRLEEIVRQEKGFK